VELSASTETVSVTPRNRVALNDTTSPVSNTITVQAVDEVPSTQRRGKVRKSKSVRLAAAEELQV
jgi:hypothetical protein